MDETELNQFLQQWDLQELSKKMALMMAVRRMFGSCIETLLLLDRYYFLNEFSSASIVSLFNSKESPKNKVLLATKN